MDDAFFDTAGALVRSAQGDLEAGKILSRAGLIGPIRQYERAYDTFEMQEAQTGFDSHLTPDSESPLTSDQYERLVAAQNFREVLLDVVGRFLEAQHYEKQAQQKAQARKNALEAAFYENVDGLRIDGLHDKNELIQLAARYVELPKLHAPTFTRLIATTVLDTELYPLRREIEDPSSVISSQLAQLSPAAAFRYHTRAFSKRASLVIFLACLVGSFAFWDSDRFWAYGFLGVGVFLLARSIWRERNLAHATNMFRANLLSLARTLELIRDEIARGGFNETAVAERLRMFETSGGYVPSIVYTLIALPSTGNGVSSGM